MRYGAKCVSANLRLSIDVRYVRVGFVWIYGQLTFDVGSYALGALIYIHGFLMERDKIRLDNLLIPAEFRSDSKFTETILIKK